MTFPDLMATHIGLVRRTFCVGCLLFAALALSVTACSRLSRNEIPDRTALYSSVGADLSWFDVDVRSAELSKRGTVVLPANVQYAWTHPSRRLLYVAWSNMTPASAAGGLHGVTAFDINSRTGALAQHGANVVLRSRPIHLTIDGSGRYVLVAHNDPSSITVFALGDDGAIGGEVMPPKPIDAGVYAHQVRVDPSNRFVFLVTRGVGPSANTPEKPGAIKVLTFANGVIANHQSIAPNGGYGFQPRNVEFHPGSGWMYGVLERQNSLVMFQRRDDGSLQELPRASVSTLGDSSVANDAQVAGAVALHPNGRFAYVANRAAGTRDLNGTPVFNGGLNSIAVFSLDPESGVPTRIASEPTRGFLPRTFALDATGQLLVAANSVPLAVRESDSTRIIPASLAVFRIGNDGRLTYARKYDVDATPQRPLMWVGIVTLPH